MLFECVTFRNCWNNHIVCYVNFWLYEHSNDIKYYRKKWNNWKKIEKSFHHNHATSYRNRLVEKWECMFSTNFITFDSLQSALQFAWFLLLLFAPSFTLFVCINRNSRMSKKKVVATYWNVANLSSICSYIRNCNIAFIFCDIVFEFRLSHSIAFCLTLLGLFAINCPAALVASFSPSAETTNLIHWYIGKWETPIYIHDTRSMFLCTGPILLMLQDLCTQNDFSLPLSLPCISSFFQTPIKYHSNVVHGFSCMYMYAMRCTCILFSVIFCCCCCYSSM